MEESGPANALTNSTASSDVHSVALVYLSAILGWMYFLAWTLSFYPQVYINWKRKSVIGLSFDFVAFNMTGFLAYSCFNSGLFWIPQVQAQYYELHPDGIAPVELNDVFFSLHAMVITGITVVQCLVYERGNQKVNNWARALLAFTWTYVIITIILACSGHMTWLNFLYGFSYIKVGVTVLKYMPQVYLNYSRKDTSGWSIGNVLLDFSGGWLSIFQMLINAYNGDDWASLLGNITKLGLGVVTIIFDTIFIVQHYVLYRDANPYGPLYDIEITSEAKAKDVEAVFRDQWSDEEQKCRVRRSSLSPARGNGNG